jgi:hypothetical protein
MRSNKQGGVPEVPVAARPASGEVTEGKGNEAPDAPRGVQTRGGCITKPTRNQDAADSKVVDSLIRARTMRTAASKPRDPRSTKEKATAAAAAATPREGSEGEEEDTKASRRTF